DARPERVAGLGVEHWRRTRFDWIKRALGGEVDRRLSLQILSACSEAVFRGAVGFGALEGVEQEPLDAPRFADPQEADALRVAADARCGEHYIAFAVAAFCALDDLDVGRGEGLNLAQVGS